jgi:tRNA A-37 threonylcarbamoyl transferase component Bud32
VSTDLIGEELDQKYRVVRHLGGGGFGDVYLAEDELARRQVAIKRLKNTDPERQKDLVHEMRSLDQLHHPNIVGFYHHFYDGSSLFLVMEHCAGGSLRDQMSKSVAHTPTVMQWGKELASVLGQVHQRGIVHHDIKPDNILFAADGTIKIGDFGGANRGVGTIPYVSPEKYRGEASVEDPRVDIYALGITLLELLLNRGAFAGLNFLEMQQAKVRHDFVPTDMERWLQEVLSRATHPTPELRFQSMADFSEAIEAKHVNYVFNRGRIQADSLAVQAEKYLARKRLSAATRCATQALFASPDCVSALVAGGRCHLFANRIDQAKESFDRALQINPRVIIQKELGWLNLEAGNYARAISLLSDHLERNGADYEGYNLLLECFYRTDRFEAGMDLARLMITEKAPSDCFVSNGLICGLRAGSDADVMVTRPLAAEVKTPFAAYSAEIRSTDPKRLAKLLVFENFRFGLSTVKENTLLIEIEGEPQEYKERLLTLGRDEGNLVRLKHISASRRHCVIVNCPGDVWVYDLSSKFGVFVDGALVHGKAYLDGVHTVTIGDTPLRISSRAGLLV